MPKKKKLDVAGVEESIGVLERFREEATTMHCSREQVVGECINRLKALLTDDAPEDATAPDAPAPTPHGVDAT